MVRKSKGNHHLFATMLYQENGGSTARQRRVWKKHRRVATTQPARLRYQPGLGARPGLQSRRCIAAILAIGFGATIQATVARRFRNSIQSALHHYEFANQSIQALSGADRRTAILFQFAV